MTEDVVYANALNLFLEIGPKRLNRLHAHFGSYKEAWLASETKLTAAGMEPEVIAALRQKRPKISPDEETHLLEKAGITVLLRSDESYPTSLSQIAVPPEILYVRGKLPKEELEHIAIIGTRKPTAYGRDACDKFTRALSKSGLGIISGLAVGIDTCAHETCLDVNGTTIAVVGSGIDGSVLYPAINRKLADKIVANGGAIISEYPLMMKSQTFMFPQRNRIVAGLTRGTLVIEASEKSGAHITANYALESGRDVFAVPGSIFSSTSVGPNNLIRQGAIPATKPQDILEAWNMVEVAEQPTLQISKFSSEETAVLGALETPQNRDDLAHTLNFSATSLSQLLTILEIRGSIKHIGNGMYRKIQ
jgi:DNA processing protein